MANAAGGGPHCMVTVTSGDRGDLAWVETKKHTHPARVSRDEFEKTTGNDGGDNFGRQCIHTIGNFHSSARVWRLPAGHKYLENIKKEKTFDLSRSKKIWQYQSKPKKCWETNATQRYRENFVKNKTALTEFELYPENSFY